MNSYGFIKSFCYVRSPKELSDSVVGSSFAMLPPVVVSPPQSPPVCVGIQAEDCVAPPAPPVVVVALIPVMFSKGG
jgi:hypothetical protein